jgi:hypothetical protein
MVMREFPDIVTTRLALYQNHPYHHGNEETNSLWYCLMISRSLGIHISVCEAQFIYKIKKIRFGIPVAFQ